MSYENFRMLFIEPRWNRIGRSTKDHFYAGLLHSIQNALHPGKLKITITWLPCAPGRFSDAHDADPGFLHQRYIFIQPVRWRVFGIVGHSVKYGLHVVGR